MSLFPRFQEFTPLIRLLDDYDRVTKAVSGSAFQSIQTFSPKFDVKETKDAYELHGELPGIDESNISIEWTDGNTLTISGRTEHRVERGQRPAGFIEGEKQEDQKKLEGGQQQEAYRKPSVEDESSSAQKESGQKDESSSGGAVTKTDQSDQQVAQKPQEEAKYWVSERAVGEFSRSFSFPTRVDQDNVKASLKNGVLTIIVPKAKAPQPRKINIE